MPPDLNIVALKHTEFWEWQLLLFQNFVINYFIITKIYKIYLNYSDLFPCP
jgi:hypothetical protein